MKSANPLDMLAFVFWMGVWAYGSGAVAYGVCWLVDWFQTRGEK